jgi:CHAD domain-containing protein
MSSSSAFGPFQKRLDAFVRELPGVGQGNVEALHSTRVASRRLRELLPLMDMDGDASGKLDRRLRRVIKQLGAVRELDVLMLLIEEFQRNRQYPPAALQQVKTAAGHVRDATRGRLMAKLSTAKLEKLASRLRRAAEAVESDDAAVRRPNATARTRAWLWALDARLARRAANLRSAIDIASGLYVPKRLHDVRIALKKLRYAAELSTEVGRRGMTADVAALKTAQDLLGRLHDLEVLLVWGREVQASLSPPDLMAWKALGALVHAVEDDCRRLHARYMRDRMALIAFTDRIGATRPHAGTNGRHAAG